MAKVLWQGKVADTEVRIVSPGERSGHQVEVLKGNALMGEPIWHEVHQMDGIHRPLMFVILDGFI